MQQPQFIAVGLGVVWLGFSMWRALRRDRWYKAYLAQRLKQGDPRDDRNKGTS